MTNDLKYGSINISIKNEGMCSGAPAFDKILLKAARNIASHDYDSLDFEIIYRRTLQLLNPKVSQELEAVVNDFEQSDTGDKPS